MVLFSAQDASPADWVVAGVRGFAESVLSLVPAGFPMYVRVFHPIRDRDGLISWSELAERHGTRVHPEMQLHAISRTWDYNDGSTGQLDDDVAARLAAVLARHTTTPQKAWFAIWEGHGGLDPDVRAAPWFELPNRGYHLLAGPVAVVEDANLWWPDDRAWCVATEIDLQSTYIGCSEEAAEELVATPGIEALAIRPDAGITFASDPLNSGA